MVREHNYFATIEWTGNKGEGTANYNSYDRNYEVIINGKSTIPASSDPLYRGDASRHNPEELFLASVAGCHMLWYLHLCSVNGIVVTSYKDNSMAMMIEENDGSGRFSSITLYPAITISNKEKLQLASELHHEANKKCFIANSLNFRVEHKPSIITQ